MKCPGCADTELLERMTKSGVLVDQCPKCQGIWLDRGEIYLFSKNPRKLESLLSSGLADPRSTERHCPHCEAAMQVGHLMKRGLEVNQCSECEGLWFDKGELQQAIQLDRRVFQVDVAELRRGPGRRPRRRSRGRKDAAPAQVDRQGARARVAGAAMPRLPNLFLRSASTLVLLYALLGTALIALVEFAGLMPELAVGILTVIVIAQFAFGPWLMDASLRWLYSMSPLTPGELPDHLVRFVRDVAAEHKMRFPSFKLIHDGAPNAFTYGHTPNNMRIVLTRGMFDLLEPEELEAVVAHEMGHGKHWDMALMTIAQLVPLLLYYVYRTLLHARGGSGKDRRSQVAVAIGAYVLYIVSEYIVLWFSRCREYHADRFAGRVTGNPNALASALVKIGYGLAARSGKRSEKKRNGKDTTKPTLDAIGAMGIFDAGAAQNLVMTAAAASGPTRAEDMGKEHVKSAMQWDLWNPWASFYELHSTHPLIAHRLQHLGDQSVAMRQKPYVVFDRRKPESYWDEFLADAAMLFLPVILLLGGVAFTAAQFALHVETPLGEDVAWLLLGYPLAGLGLGMLLKTLYSYRGTYFAPLSIAGLLHKVKVSSVRPVPARLRGTIIGRGVPGLIWSDDFVLRDSTGILFLDYRQPLRIWEWLFGLLRAADYQDTKVEVTGWFRRAPVPYLEIKTMTTPGKVRRCYAYHAKLIGAVVLMIVGVGVVLFI